MMEKIIKKSEIIARIGEKLTHIPLKNINLSVHCILQQMQQALCDQRTLSIRGFGTLKLHHHPARDLYSPQTGKTEKKEARHVPHFKPGKILQEKLKN